GGRAVEGGVGAGGGRGGGGPGGGDGRGTGKKEGPRGGGAGGGGGRGGGEERGGRGGGGRAATAVAFHARLTRTRPDHQDEACRPPRERPISLPCVPLAGPTALRSAGVARRLRR